MKYLALGWESLYAMCWAGEIVRAIPLWVSSCFFFSPVHFLCLDSFLFKLQWFISPLFFLCLTLPLTFFSSVLHMQHKRWLHYIQWIVCKAPPAPCWFHLQACVSWPAVFFPSAKHFKKTFLSVSAHQAVLLWGLSDTRHKLWLWMTSRWPRHSCGTGTQKHIAANFFHGASQTHTTFNLTELLSGCTPAPVTCDLITMESCQQCLCQKVAHSAGHTLKRMQTRAQHLPVLSYSRLSFLSAHIPVRGVTRTVCLISVRWLVITEIKGHGKA